MSVEILCEHQLEAALQADEGRDANLWTKLMNQDVALVVRWRTGFYPAVNSALDAKDLAAQRLRMRGVLLDAAYNKNRSRAFILKNSTKSSKDASLRDWDERSILASAWDDGATSAEISAQRHLESIAVNECTIHMVRAIQEIGFQDASPIDYFPLWDDLTGQYWHHIAESEIARIQGTTYPIDILIAPLGEKIAELKANVIAGGNYEYDRAKIDAEKAAEEAARKAAEPSRVRNVSNSQIDELAAYLVERFGRLNLGELFRINDEPAEDIGAGFRVDSGVMLVAMRECVIDPMVAEDALREVVFRVQLRLLSPESRPNSAAEVAIDQQREIAGIWEEEERGRLPGVALIGGALIHPTAFQNRDDLPDGMRSWGGACASLMEDIWTTFAYTKNVFGWNLAMQLIPSTSEPTDRAGE